MTLTIPQPLQHGLTPHFEALRSIRTRKALLATALYAQLRDELGRVLGGVERGDHAGAAGAPHQPGRLRVAAWNIQRGTHLEELKRALATDPVLSRADVLLLLEVDDGLGRSGNVHVARALAEALSLHYAFGVSYLTLEDDFGENPGQVPNTLALAGQAVLSRLPIRRAESVDLPELRDKFSSAEKRLGKKRALLVEVEAPGGPVAIGGCHLDSTASPAQRAAQLDFLLGRLEATGLERLLVGGDFNTTTWDASSPLATFRDIFRKVFFVGFGKTIDHYMVPEQHDEAPIFEALARRGYVHEGFNDRTRGTIRHDFNSPYAYAKVKGYAGGLLTRYFMYRLRPWKGVVDVRLDWFAGRGLQPLAAAVVPPAVDALTGVAASDHGAVVVDVAM
jgi:endonuclease/exonuclease/phosphatase family metal-dependent hydrolase